MEKQLFDDRYQYFCQIYDIPLERFHYACQELFFWQYSNGGSNFSALLYDLIAKADSSNREKILRGFPEFCLAFSLWKSCENNEEFYEHAGVGFGRHRAKNSH